MSLASLRPRRGAFPNGMTYARLGDGPEALLWLSAATKGPMLAMMTRVIRPLVADGYSVWLVSGRPDMPTGHTLLDMADDYAALVAEEFGGRVDLVIGHSTGGFIGFCLAAKHPDRFANVVIAGAALWNQRSDQANLEFSRLLVAGRTREAGEHVSRLLAPDIRVPGLASALGILLARASLTVASAGSSPDTTTSHLPSRRARIHGPEPKTFAVAGCVGIGCVFTPAEDAQPNMSRPE